MTSKTNEKKHFDFCFTVNNYRSEWIQQILSIPKTRYIIVGEEIAPSTKTKHLQGYVYFETQKTLSSVIKIFKFYNNPHIWFRGCAHFFIKKHATENSTK